MTASNVSSRLSELVVTAMDQLSPDGEELCATADRLAAALVAYEEQGGKDMVADVLGRPPYREVFRAEESAGHLDRPSARCTIVLRSGGERDVVVGTAGLTDWFVERLRQLSTTVVLAPGQRVGIDDAGHDVELTPPPRDYAWDQSVRRLRFNDTRFLMSASLWLHDRVRRKSYMRTHPEWLPDPARRHALRYWDGSRWTRFVVVRRPHRNPDEEDLPAGAPPVV